MCAGFELTPPPRPGPKEHIRPPEAGGPTCPWGLPSQQPEDSGEKRGSLQEALGGHAGYPNAREKAEVLREPKKKVGVPSVV